MAGFLFLGFLIGMSHALEADHLAAVGALASSGEASPKRLAFLGASWGAGHTLTLFLISLAIIVFGAVLTDQIAAGLELAIGVLLVGLGISVMRKIYINRIHFHVHRHEGGKKHFHAHSHAVRENSFQQIGGNLVPHRADPHQHAHTTAFSLRAFVIGLAHGAAGSAGLVALAVATTQNPVAALLYVGVFGVGSLLGMALLTFSASWPLRLAEGRAAGLFRAIQIAVAGTAVFVGISVAVKAAPILLASG